MADVGSDERVAWFTFIAAHRARTAQRRNRDDRDRVLIFARDPNVLGWIEHELFGEPVSSTVVEALTDVVANLTLIPPPWPNYLIIDANEISSADVLLLGAIREAGWPGIVIAIGDVCRETHSSLGIDIVVSRNFRSEQLRNALKQAGVGRAA